MMSILSRIFRKGNDGSPAKGAIEQPQEPQRKVIDGENCVPAFTVEGRTWYMIDDMYHRLPYARYNMAIQFYTELEMRMTREFAMANIAAALLELDKPKPSIIQAVKYLQCLQERFEWIYDADIAWKLGTVVFFEEDESMLGWNAKRSSETIAFWKQHLDESFFLQKPWQTFIPSPEMLQHDTQRCLNLFQKAREIDAKWLEHLRGLDLSKYMKTADLERLNLLLGMDKTQKLISE